MTRFLMSLDESVDLVLHAFNNAEQGDIFVQKAPASTIETLASALLELFRSNNKVKIIGTRHGEKLYESLVSREEMVRAVDLDRYYRIPADARDLNYNLYYSEGEGNLGQSSEYTSHNTDRLDTSGVKLILEQLDFVQRELQRT